MGDPFTIPKSPKHVGIEYALLVLFVGMIAGAPIAAIAGRSNVERGMMLGVGLVPAALVAYAIGYGRQKRRLGARISLSGTRRK